MAKLLPHRLILGKLTYMKPHNQEEILEKVANLILYGSSFGKVPLTPAVFPQKQGFEEPTKGRVS